MTFSKDGSGQNTPNMPDEMGGTAPDAATPTTPSMSMAHPVNLGEAKVSLHALPPDTKEGDTVTLKVSRIDAGNNCAYLSQDGENGGVGTEDNEGGEKEGSEESTDGAVSPNSPDNSPDSKGIDTSLLTGPLSNLKNYLAQKSVDNQTRTYTK